MNHTQPPEPPAGYTPPTRLERRQAATLAALEHNRRQGWMLHIAARYGIVPIESAIDSRTELAELLLPDLFGQNDVDAALYAGLVDDLDLALELLVELSRPVRVVLPSGRALQLVLGNGTTVDDLPDLGLRT